MTLFELMEHKERLIDLFKKFREAGVLEFSAGGCSFKLKDPIVPPPSRTFTEQEKMTMKAMNLCACGHAVYNHSEIGCLEGCDLESCTPNHTDVDTK